MIYTNTLVYLVLLSYYYVITLLRFRHIATHVASNFLSWPVYR